MKGLYDAPLIFAFERVSSENFTYIPMAVRFNLDRFGVRISLAQWQRLALEDRILLARFPLDDIDGAAVEPRFDHALFDMLRTYANITPERFIPDARSESMEYSQDAVPQGVLHQIRLVGLAEPTREQWAGLDPFKRYVLTKLSRKPEANHDFVPAMREFGLN